VKKQISLALVLIFAAASGCSGKPTKTEEAKIAKESPAAHSAASAPKESEENQVSCRRGSDVRVIGLVSKDIGCELEYGKPGKGKKVASSAHGKKHCEDTRAKIRMHLEKAGFSCL
jgi:hypothetical protein